MIPDFTTTDLVAVRIKCKDGKDQKEVVVWSPYFASDSVEMPLPTEFKKLIEHCFEKKLKLLVGKAANVHYTVWDSSDVN